MVSANDSDLTAALGLIISTNRAHARCSGHDVNRPVASLQQTDTPCVLDPAGIDGSNGAAKRPGRIDGRQPVDPLRLR